MENLSLGTRNFERGDELEAIFGYVSYYLKISVLLILFILLLNDNPSGDSMDIDIITVVCILLALVVGAALAKVLNSVEANRADMMLDKMKTYFENYGSLIQNEDPALYKRVQKAIETIDKAYSDNTISALEALEIASEFYPVFKELAEYAKGKSKA